MECPLFIACQCSLRRLKLSPNIHRVSLPLTQLKQVLRLFKGKYKFSFWSRSRSFLDSPLIPTHLSPPRMGVLCSRVELRCYPPPVAAVLPLFLLRQELYTHFVCVGIRTCVTCLLYKSNLRFLVFLFSNTHPLPQPPQRA